MLAISICFWLLPTLPSRAHPAIRISFYAHSMHAAPGRPDPPMYLTQACRKAASHASKKTVPSDILLFTSTILFGYIPSKLEGDYLIM